ncbi:MAG: helix-turn-helix transcriptional regulator [Cyanobacteria bacterium P01_C01_bin.72]
MSKDKSQADRSVTKEVFPMKEIREALGMSQVKFAVAIGIDPGTVSRAERGLTEPVFTALQMKRLCRLTNKSIEEIPDYLGKDFSKHQLQR